MFYQKYAPSKNETYLSNIDYFNKKEKYLQSKVAYYISGTIPKLYVKGDNGNYELSKDTEVFYNPLNNATLYTDKECNEKFLNANVAIYQIKNLLDEKTVSKVQVEFSEKNNPDSLSKNAIFINADIIRGYQQTNNIYSFETVDAVTTKIRYLGIIPVSLSEDECIILNYYTTD